MMEASELLFPSRKTTSGVTVVENPLNNTCTDGGRDNDDASNTSGSTPSVVDNMSIGRGEEKAVTPKKSSVRLDRLALMQKKIILKGEGRSKSTGGRRNSVAGKNKLKKFHF
jgi:hypothetical protein